MKTLQYVETEIFIFKLRNSGCSNLTSAAMTQLSNN